MRFISPILVYNNSYIKRGNPPQKHTTYGQNSFRPSDNRLYLLLGLSYQQLPVCMLSSRAVLFNIDLSTAAVLSWNYQKWSGCFYYQFSSLRSPTYAPIPHPSNILKTYQDHLKNGYSETHLTYQRIVLVINLVVIRNV